MAANVAAPIVQTPAARPSTPSMKLRTFISATIPITVSVYETGALRWTGPMKGSVRFSTRTPAETGITAARICPMILKSAESSRRSSAAPTRAITAAPIRIESVSLLRGRKTRPAVTTAVRIARPPSRGVGNWCSPRSRGMSMAPIRHARAPATGVARRLTTRASPSARKPSVRSGTGRATLAGTSCDSTLSAGPLRAGAPTAGPRGAPTNSARRRRRTRPTARGGGLARGGPGYPRRMAPSERKRRAAGLDGLRALAALSVLGFHTWLYGFDNPSAVARDSFYDHAMFELRLGLIFFFVLSGYLLYGAFVRSALARDERVDVRRYARRRIARILPAYWLATLGTIALLWGGSGTPGIRLPEASDLPLFAVFGQNYSLDTIMTLNPVTWTLCLEAAFYVLLPLIGAMSWRLGPRALGRQALLVGALIPLGIAWNQLAHDYGWSIIATKALPAYLPYFACGMLLALWAQWRRRGDAKQIGPRATAAMVVGGFAIVVGDAYWHATAAPRPGNVTLAVLADIPAGFGFALVVAAAVAGGGVATRWMSFRPLAWVGLVSYGLYMWHVPVLLFERRIGVFPDAYPVRLLLLLVPALALAAASWYLVERPLIAWAGRPREKRGAARGRARRGQSQQLEAAAAP